MTDIGTSQERSRSRLPDLRVHPASAPSSEGEHSICPHCWGVNPGMFRLCARCGADMRTILQESGGLRRTAAVQSPVPVGTARRLGLGQRAVLCLFVVMMALSYLVHLLPQGNRAPQGLPAPATTP
ncbi:MAG: hypothetical protein R3E98_14955 [Gemmatimonadota bacterium]